MRQKAVARLLVAMMAMAAAASVRAQAPSPYGLPISLENAKKAAAPALAEAAKNNPEHGRGDRWIPRGTWCTSRRWTTRSWAA